LLSRYDVATLAELEFFSGAAGYHSTLVDDVANDWFARLQGIAGQPREIIEVAW
jgi:hypothetical protein